VYYSYARAHISRHTFHDTHFTTHVSRHTRTPTVQAIASQRLLPEVNVGYAPCANTVGEAVTYCSGGSNIECVPQGVCMHPVFIVSHAGICHSCSCVCDPVFIVSHAGICHLFLFVCIFGSVSICTCACVRVLCACVCVFVVCVCA
jgi:hypothetical protein